MLNSDFRFPNFSITNFFFYIESFLITRNLENVFAPYKQKTAISVNHVKITSPNIHLLQLLTAPRNCHQCGDLASSNPCSTLQVYTAPSTPCPAGLDFCMTDIHHDTSGNDHIYKRFWMFRIISIHFL